MYRPLLEEADVLLRSSNPALAEAQRTLAFRLEALRARVSDLSYEMEDLSAEIVSVLKEQGEITPTPDQATRLRDLELQKKVAKAFVVPFTLAYAQLAESQ